MNYYPGKPQTFKNICLKCNSTRFLDVPIMCCMWCVFSFFLLHIFYFWARSNWLLSCCDVPANVYILIVFFWVFFFFWRGGGGGDGDIKANLIKVNIVHFSSTQQLKLESVLSHTYSRSLNLGFFDDENDLISVWNVERFSNPLTDPR